jgi:hypothetical protein
MSHAPDGELISDKHNRAVEMFRQRILHDEELESYAHEQHCYHECMNIREHLLQIIDGLYWV